MYERSIDLFELLTVVLWVLAGALLAAAWVSWVLGMGDQLSALFGFTACATSAVAATCNIRCFAARLARLVRLAGQLPAPERRCGLGLRSVGR